MLLFPSLQNGIVFRTLLVASDRNLSSHRLNKKFIDSIKNKQKLQGSAVFATAGYGSTVASRIVVHAPSLPWTHSPAGSLQLARKMIIRHPKLTWGASWWSQKEMWLLLSKSHANLQGHRHPGLTSVRRRGSPDAQPVLGRVELSD